MQRHPEFCQQDRQARSPHLGGAQPHLPITLQRFAAKTRHSGPRFRLGPVATNVLGLVGDTWAKLTGHEPEMNSSGLWLSSQQHCFSSQRAEEEIGYHIRPLQETIDDAWNWLRNYGFLKVAA
ncbi:MAG: hypothetical protein U0894_11795 [Pirellulales bacterium]